MMNVFGRTSELTRHSLLIADTSQMTYLSETWLPGMDILRTEKGYWEGEDLVNKSDAYGAGSVVYYENDGKLHM